MPGMSFRDRIDLRPHQGKVKILSFVLLLLGFLLTPFGQLGFTDREEYLPYE